MLAVVVTLDEIFANSDNGPLLAFLGLASPSDVRYVAPGDQVSPFDEGGVLFFDDWAAAIPAGAKMTIDISNVLVHERTAQIFACHQGRLTVFFRCDFARTGVTSRDSHRVGETLDGGIDIRALGPAWALLHAFCDDIEQQLSWAHDLAGTRAAASG